MLAMLMLLAAAQGVTKAPPVARTAPATKTPSAPAKTPPVVANPLPIVAKRGFTVDNVNAETPVAKVWYADGATEWQEIKDLQPIAPKTARRFELGAGTKCTYVVRIQFTDNYTQVFGNVDVCKGASVKAD